MEFESDIIKDKWKNKNKQDASDDLDDSFIKANGIESSNRENVIKEHIDITSCLRVGDDQNTNLEFSYTSPD